MIRALALCLLAAPAMAAPVDPLDPQVRAEIAAHFAAAYGIDVTDPTPYCGLKGCTETAQVRPRPHPCRPGARPCPEAVREAVAPLIVLAAAQATAAAGSLSFGGLSFGGSGSSLTEIIYGDTIIGGDTIFAPVTIIETHHHHYHYPGCACCPLCEPVDVAPVPLPAGGWLLAAGLGLLTIFNRRNKKC